MSENFKQPAERNDRVLGDEWLEWQGDGGKSVETGKGLFLGFSLAVLLVIDATLFLLYYLVLPRIHQFHAVIPSLVLWAMIIWTVSSSIFWVQLVLTVYSGKNYFFLKKQIFFVFDLVFQRVFRLAKLLRISRDKMGHSFVLVSNAVVRAIDRAPKENKKLLILLPRCLTKEVLQDIYKLKDRFPIEVFTVSGGELARKKVKETKPTAIIGVACERDLVSGIRDVANKISVIGIPNQRPNGPCKDTVVDIAEITRAVEFYFR